MRNWIQSFARFQPKWLASALFLLLLPASALAQVPSATSEVVAIAAESMPAAVSSVLDRGNSLEASGRWGDALAHYEEALRAHPNDRDLQSRFDIARIHYSLEQRYGDNSFRQSILQLDSSEALDLYVDLLEKIDTHYVTTPPWRDIAIRGGRALDIALADREFIATNGIHPRPEQLEQFRRDLARFTSQSQVRSRRDLVAVAAETARLAAQRIGLSQSSTLLEFTAAAAGGLDHYSAFLTADQLKDVYSQIEGNFVGLGVELKASDGALLIVGVIPGSPAERAEIKAGDRITAVDGRATRDLATDQAAALLTGEEGTVVRVTVETPGRSPRTLTISRAHVEVPSLERVSIVEPSSGVAYVRVPTFQKTTARDLEAALWDLHRQGMRSLILDLRGNPGGLLTASVELADKFIANGAIVTTQGRNAEEDFNYRARRPGTWRVPLVVLVDGDSASASEIFAGAIKDSGRGTIVGEKSYGKGSVQGIFPLARSGTGIRLTTAHFYSPDGHPISGLGVSPHIDVRRATQVASGSLESSEEQQLVGYRGLPEVAQEASNTIEDNAVSIRGPLDPNQDRALQKAVEVARDMQPAVL